jgi:cyclase
MKTTMFFGAAEVIFANAKQLRNNPTNAELKLWMYLRTKPLDYKFRRQHPIRNFIADFYCHKKKLIIEVDGNIHRLPEVALSDLERTNTLQSEGIKIIRFTNKQVLYEFEQTINQIETILKTPPLGGGGSTPPLESGGCNTPFRGLGGGVS